MKKYLNKILLVLAVAVLLFAQTAFATILPVSQGGTGVNNITGLIKGNGTAPFSVAVPGGDYLQNLSVGTPVIGSGPNQVLFSDGGTALQSDPNFTYNPGAQALTSLGAVNTHFLQTSSGGLFCDVNTYSCSNEFGTAVLFLASGQLGMANNSGNHVLDVGISSLADNGGTVSERWDARQLDSYLTPFVPLNTFDWSDFNNIRMGDVDGNQNHTYINVADSAQQITGNNQGVVNGLSLDFTANLHSFGDIPNNTAFSVDGANGVISGQTFGISQLYLSDGFGLQQIGDIGCDWDCAMLNIDHSSRITTLQDSGNAYLSMDYGAADYQLGDVYGVGSNTLLSVDDGAKQIRLNSAGSIEMNGVTNFNSPTTFNADSDYTSHYIHNVLDPILPQDVATMNYVTTAISGVSGALTYYGVWDASLNSPTLASGTGVTGEYYVVDVAGTTTLDGISTWNVGDWAIFNGSVWERLVGGVTYTAGPGLALSGSAFSIDDTYANTWTSTQTFNVAPVLSSFSSGSVLFAGSGGTISENHGNLFWDDSNVRLGIGTVTPTTYLNIVKKANGPYIELNDTVVGSGQLSNAIRFTNGLGTKWDIGSINNSPTLAFQQAGITLATFGNGGNTFGTFSASGAGNKFVNILGNTANTSGVSSGLSMTLTNGNSVTGGLAAIDVNANGIYSGSGEQLLANLKTAGAISRWKADITGKTTQTGNAKFGQGATLDLPTAGSAATAGTATLAAGTVTISTTAIAVGDVIELTRNTPGGTLGVSLTAPSGSVVPGSSFIINSVDAGGVPFPLDTSTVYWMIVHVH